MSTRFSLPPAPSLPQPPRRRRVLRLPIVVCLVGLMTYALVGQAGDRSTPYTPTRDDTVLQHVPTVTDPRVRQFQELAQQWRQDRHNRKLAIRLAKAYIDYGRSTGDARFLGRALAPIDPWLDDQPIPVDILIVHATILQSRHQFDAARRELAAALKRTPGNAQGWLTLATVNMVQGDFRNARKNCVHAANTGGRYLAIVCNGDLLSLTGNAGKAYQLMGLIAQGGPQIPTDVSAYVQGLLADTARRLGHREAAETHYKKGLQLTPGDNFLLADYADFLLDDKRYADVIQLLKPYTASDTSFLRLVYAEVGLDKPQTDADIQAMTERFQAMDTRGSHLYRREQAGFVLHLLDKPQRALTLAQENWQVQRAPKDVRVLLETALGAQQPRAAQPALDFIQRTGLQGPIVNRLAQQARQSIANLPTKDAS